MTQEKLESEQGKAHVPDQKGQTNADLLKWTIRSLCVFVIILQAFDAISTFMALSTGHLVEKNELLTRTAKVLEIPIGNVVLGAKFLVASLFGWLMLKQKPTLNAVVILFFFVAFYMTVVQRNFYWISIVQSIKSK
jgi:Domain of unknown function (DUF5658)